MNTSAKHSFVSRDITVKGDIYCTASAILCHANYYTSRSCQSTTASKLETDKENKYAAAPVFYRCFKTMSVSEIHSHHNIHKLQSRELDISSKSRLYAKGQVETRSLQS